jgi:hypothetical protein
MIASLVPASVPRPDGALGRPAGIADALDGPLFRTTGRATGEIHRMTQPDAYRMIQRRAPAAGIKTRVGNHSLRAPYNQPAR